MTMMPGRRWRLVRCTSYAARPAVSPGLWELGFLGGAAAVGPTATVAGLGGWQLAAGSGLGVWGMTRKGARDLYFGYLPQVGNPGTSKFLYQPSSCANSTKTNV